MPRHRNHFIKGTLFLTFKIQFPLDGSIPPETQQALEKLLPAKPPPPEFGEEAEEVHLSMDARAPGASSNGHQGQAYDEDEAGHGGGGGVKCQPQ